MFLLTGTLLTTSLNVSAAAAAAGDGLLQTYLTLGVVVVHILLRTMSP